MTVEPLWIPIDRMGSDYDEQLDVGAAPDAPDAERYRHRKRCYSRTHETPWIEGPAPRGSK